MDKREEEGSGRKERRVRRNEGDEGREKGGKFRPQSSFQKSTARNEDGP